MHMPIMKVYDPHSSVDHMHNFTMHNFTTNLKKKFWVGRDWGGGGGGGGGIPGPTPFVLNNSLIIYKVQ